MASRNIMAKIKSDYLSRLLSINISHYDKNEDQFVSTVTNDLQRMMGLFDTRMTSTVETISYFFFGNLAGIYASWKIGLLSMGIMTTSFTIIYFTTKVAKRKSKEERVYNVGISKIASEVIGNARTVTAYGGQAREIEKYETQLSGVKRYGFRASLVTTVARGFNYFMFCFAYVGAYYFAAYFYVHDEFNPGNLCIVLVAQLNVIYHSTMLLNTVTDMLMAIDTADRVITLIDTEANFRSSLDDGIRVESFKGDIHFQNVIFSYPSNPKTKVLQGLELKIAPGKVTGVVGTSGAGKSTLVGLISRLYDPLAGQVLIDGIDVRHLNLRWLRDQIGVVGQEPALFDTTIEENIRMGKPDATLEEVKDAARLANAHTFISKLPEGYDSVVGERGTKLSGGQKQRIAIARALVRKPKILLLDEATSALDSRSEHLVQKALDKAMSGRTTIVVAHRMATVRNADVIYAMKGGRVVESGSHEHLMKRAGYYQGLVKIQESEEKDKASGGALERSISENEIDEEFEDLTEESLEEVIHRQRIKFFKKKNMKMIGMWFLAFTFCCFVSCFLPAFYHIFTFLHESFAYPKEELHDRALSNIFLLTCVAVITFVAEVVAGVTSKRATQVWLTGLQRKAFRRVVTMDISWFDKSGNTPNETVELLTNAPLIIDSVGGERAAQVLIFFLSIFFTLLFALYMNVSITLVNIPIIISFIIINCLRLRAKKSDSRSTKFTTKSTKIATEYVQNVKTIQLLNCQNYVLKGYEALLKRSKKEAYMGVIWYGIVYGLSKALVRFSIGASLVLGATLVSTGEFPGTQLIGLVISLSVVSMLAGPALVLLSQYPAATEAASRLYRLIRTKTVIDVLSEKGLKPEIKGDIFFENVTFSYPTREKVQILKNFNLHIEEGKTIALVGGSGCGKSTTISLLERFYVPASGKIIIDGSEINDINVDYLRKQMGLVSQEPVLFDLTIKENILYGIDEELPEYKIIDAAKIANIHDFIMTLPQSYDTRVGERGSKLSGGQKQRIAIARAVLRDPKILLLDEATSALDTESEKIVQRALERASEGRTTIVIAHRLSTIRKADKIAVLDNGVVIEEGNHDELMAYRGFYFKLVQKK